LVVLLLLLLFLWLLENQSLFVAAIAGFTAVAGVNRCTE
jgi:hypothetical protein